MTTSADVVVIGGGILGVSTAFHLAATGVKRVTLLERHFVGAGATGKSHSLVRMHYTNPHDAALAQASLPYFHHWPDLVGAGNCVFVQTGAFRFASAGEELKLRGNVEMLRAVGVNTWIVDSAEIQSIDPGLAVDDLTCAAWEPDSGYADPLTTANGFARATIERGGSVRTGVEVTGIQEHGGRVTGVETTEGIVEVDVVVVANGSWAPPLMAPFGFDVPLVPKRVPVVVFRRPDVERGPQTVLLDGSIGIVVRPDGNDDLLVAIGFDKDRVDPDRYDEGIGPEFVAECRERIIRRRPGMAGAPSRGGWAGVTPETPDGHIVIDKLAACDGLYVAVGCSGTNFKTAPAIGKCLAEWIVDGKPSTADLHAFRASRFAEGDPITGRYEYGAGATDIWR